MEEPTADTKRQADAQKDNADKDVAPEKKPLDIKVKIGLAVLGVVVLLAAVRVIQAHRHPSYPARPPLAMNPLGIGHMPQQPVGIPHPVMPPGGGTLSNGAGFPNRPGVQEGFMSPQRQMAQPSVPAPTNAINRTVSPEARNNVVSLLNTLSGGHASVKAVYPGPDGLIGVYWITESGVKRIGWASPGGNLLLVGAAFAVDGKDWTAMANAKIQGKKYDAGMLPKIDPRSGIVNSEAAKELYAKVVHLKYFSSGRGKKVVYIFADPDCIYCHKFWETIGKNQRDVQIRWILTGGIHPTSAAKAATILASKNPLRSWILNEAKYSSENEQGGVKPLDGPDKSPVIANDKALIGTLQMGGTPTFVWKDKHGTPHARMGIESLADWKNIVRSM